MHTLTKSLLLLSFALTSGFTTVNAFAQDDEEVASPMVVTPFADESGSPGMVMPSDGEFEAAPAPSDWEEDPGSEDLEGEDF